MTTEIRELDAEAARGLVEPLAAILVDCVEDNASINFVWPFTLTDAVAWWRGVIDRMDAGTLVLLGAFRDDDLVGSAQLGLEMPPNQRHRAEVRKVIVHRGARGLGIGTALMAALDGEARRRGRTLLTLDTAAGSSGDRLYQRLGWTRFGTVPGFALYPDGQPGDCAFFWKHV